MWFCRVLFLLIGIVIGSSHLHADEPLDIVSYLEEIADGRYHARVNFGQLDIGARKDVVLKLRQREGGLAIDLSRAIATCGCVKVSSDQETLSPGGEATLRVKVSLPSSEKQATWMQTLTFDSIGSDFGTATLKLECRVRGVLATSVHNLVLALADSTADYVAGQLEVVATSPVSVSNLVVESGHPKFHLLEVQVAPIDGDRGTININIKARDVPENGIVIPMVIRDKSTNAKTEFLCTVTRRSDIEVAPSTIRFSREDNGDWVGTAIVILRPKELHSGAISIGASLLNQPIKLEYNSQAEHVNRVRLRIRDKSFQDAMENGNQIAIDWNIAAGATGYRARTSIVSADEKLFSPNTE